MDKGSSLFFVKDNLLVSFWYDKKVVINMSNFHSTGITPIANKAAMTDNEYSFYRSKLRENTTPQLFKQIKD
jgi:hypothetical protein